MIYLTFNESVSGVYISQVIDVVKMLHEASGNNIKLVALVSTRNYLRNRQEILKLLPDSCVLPMVPKIRNWRLNAVQLVIATRLLDQKSIIARGPIAANLAIISKRWGKTQSVCYDGRGARAAEIREYSPGHPLEDNIALIEKRAVLESDIQLAVTTKLIDYWGVEYGFEGTKCEVIPCSLSEQFENITFNKQEVKTHVFGWRDTDTVLVYSGSTSGWQSLTYIEDLVRNWLIKSEKIKILFLSRASDEIRRLIVDFPGQVQQRWIPHNDVPKYLCACDYGILVRESTVTNQVAAPVKFAEYLACGLRILCSEGLGDYTDFVKEHACGDIVCPGNAENVEIHPVSLDDKNRARRLAKEFFSKQCLNIKGRYRNLMKRLVMD